MSMSQFFEESNLIRKQREEIILLTNELKNQEIQLNLFNDEVSKFKSTIKIYEKKLQDADGHMKVYENQIKELKCQNDEKDKEIELIKSKLNNKEAFFNKKLLKLTQCEFTIEKLNKELGSETNTIKELKNENSKLLAKLAEQSNRYKESKFKNEELTKTIESKNNLLDLAKNQIVNLETKLNDLIKFINTKKIEENNNSVHKSQNQSIDNKQIEIKLNKTEQNSILSTWRESNIDEKKLNNPNHLINLLHEILSKKHDNQLSSLLQSLKEHWFETNVICEQIKGFLIAKYPKKLSNNETYNENLRMAKDTNITNERLTSTPVNF